MTADPRLAHLSPGRRRLVELMRHLGFGTVERLVVRAGEPVWSPAPRVTREVKFPQAGDEATPRPAGDFALKRQVRELLALLDSHPDATLERVEVKHGLPFRAVLVESEL